MATEPTKPSESTKTINWSEAEKHLTTIKEKIMSFAGKSGHNPYLWWAEHGQELETAMKATTRDETLHKKVLALKFEVPTV
jgi:hypothetical protein